MQVLWSRTAQARSCRCASCLNAATTAVTRRTTTAAGRRRLNGGDALAALSSAMFATAALADAKLKEDRTRQWDQAIEDVKAGRNTTTPDGYSVSTLTTDLEDRSSQDVIKSVKIPIRKVLNASTISGSSTALQSTSIPTDPEITPLWIQLKILGEHLRQDLQDETNDEVRESSGEVSRTVSKASSLEYDAKIPPREPKTRTHLDKMQGMVSRLVSKLLLGVEGLQLEAPLISQRKDAEARRPVTSEMLFVHRGSTTLPSYNPQSWNVITTQRRLLNASIASILKNVEKPDQKAIDSMIVKICYGLLTSNSPPDIQTYYILIRSFTEMKQHHLATPVVDSLLNDSLFRPDEPTIAAVLSHYRAIKGQSEFKNLVQQMKGVESGFKYRRRHVNELAKKDVQEWALNSTVMHRGAWINEKFARDAQVFKALILGAADILSLNRAVAFLKSAIREGVTVPVNVLSSIFQRIIDANDARLAIRVVSALLQQWKDALSPQSELKYTVTVRGQVCQLMRLCGLQLDYVQNPKSLPHTLDPILFNRFVRHMHFEGLRDPLIKHAGRIDSVRRRAAMLISTSSEVPKERLSSLLETIQALEDDLLTSMHRNILPKHRYRHNRYMQRREHLELGLAVKVDDLLARVHRSFEDDEFWLEDTRQREKLAALENTSVSKSADAPSALEVVQSPQMQKEASLTEPDVTSYPQHKIKKRAVIIPENHPPLLPAPSFGLFAQPLLRRHEAFASIEHRELEAMGA